MQNLLARLDAPQRGRFDERLINLAGTLRQLGRAEAEMRTLEACSPSSRVICLRY
jgi:hypothetical protein